VAILALSSAGSTARLTLENVQEFLGERLARYKHPRAVEVVDALPRNPAGKVLKTELRARFGKEDLIDAGESSSVSTVSVNATEG
jgi:fatty-acyl-CoA synthase